jgi:hypothetical protein
VTPAIIRDGAAALAHHVLVQQHRQAEAAHLGDPLSAPE